MISNTHNNYSTLSENNQTPRTQFRKVSCYFIPCQLKLLSKALYDI